MKFIEKKSIIKLLLIVVIFVY